MENWPQSSPDKDWSPDQRRDYERECLRETREQLTRVTGGATAPHELRGVRLDGGYPDTAVLVTLWDPRYGDETTTSYPLWKLPVFVGWQGNREPPNQVGMLITTWSLGG